MAIGDALGAPFEGLDRSEVSEKMIIENISSLTYIVPH